MKKRISRLWLNIMQVGAVLVLAAIVMNWGYVSSQVSAWWTYDVVKTSVVEEVVLEEPNWLAIPSLGLQAPLVYVETTDEPTLQRGLQQGVVHYPGTASPGEFGNAYYFGHSSDYAFKKGNYKTVFAILPKIELGANIYITNQAGKQFIYQVIEKRVVEARDTSVLSQGDGKQKLLTLQTSWPLGTALKRYVVVAEMR